MNDTTSYTPEEISAAEILKTVYRQGFKDGVASVRARPGDILAAPLPTVPPEEQEKTATLPLSASVASLGLTTRPYKLIRHDGIHTISDLMARSEEDLKDIRNLGPTGFDDIRVKLALVGYRLRPG